MKKITVFLSAVGAVSMLVPYVVLAQTGGSVDVGDPQGMPVRICPYDKILRQGASGEDVKALQSLLSEDKSVYPEGLKTGYFGGLTLEALKRLQKKFGLAPSGELDTDTRAVLFPCQTLRVVSPNGGETWQVGQSYDIVWVVDAPYYILQEPDVTGRKLKSLAPSRGAELPASAIRPFYPNLSIDLMREGRAVFHIGGASLYGDQSFKWNIPRSILEARDYKVRIGMWKNVPEPFDCKLRPCPLAPEIYPSPWRGYLWDESDDSFAITGGTPEVSPAPTPDYSKLRALRAEIVATIERLQKALQLIDGLLGDVVSNR
ncbi:MAG: peptidoglycan-binding protein [Parcubacteria group bacterium]|nr:peptidoglycan-binding protein [Parcubacteria group bacterium]